MTLTLEKVSRWALAAGCSLVKSPKPEASDYGSQMERHLASALPLAKI